MSTAYWLTPEETRTITEHLVRFREDNPSHMWNERVSGILLEIGSFEARGTAQPQKLKNMRSAISIKEDKLPLYLSEEERNTILSIVPSPIDSLDELL